jgi:SulP family sulfate permease
LVQAEAVEPQLVGWDGWQWAVGRGVGTHSPRKTLASQCPRAGRRVPARDQRVERRGGLVGEDIADEANGDARGPYDAALASDPDIVVYRISGAFFFGAAASVSAALDRIGEHPKAYVIDFSQVSIIDSTAAVTLEGFAAKARRHGAHVWLAGAGNRIRRELESHGVKPPQVHHSESLAAAIKAASREIAQGIAHETQP